MPTLLRIEQMYAPRCPRCYRFIGRCLQLLEAFLGHHWQLNGGTVTGSRTRERPTCSCALSPALAPVTLPKHDKKGCYQLSEAVNVTNSDPEENTNQRTLVRCNSSGRAGLNPILACPRQAQD